MIKIFRNVRQQVLSQNKFSKYILYAIGEIILVVIGILIALQVNNWNEGRKSNIRAHDLLREMQVEIIQDTIDMGWNLSQHEAMLKAEEMLLNVLNGEDDMLPADFSFAMALGIDPTSAVQRSSIESLKNEGLSIIQNDSLRFMISKLYDFYYRVIDEIENRQENYDFYSRKLDLFSKNFKLDRTKGNTITDAEENADVSIDFDEIAPIDFEKLKNNEEFKIILSQSNFYRKLKISYYKETLERIVRLDCAITKELNAK